MSQIATAALGAVLGGLAGLLSGFWTARYSQRAAITHSLLSEFLSAPFLQHRISIAITRRRLLAGSVTAAELAGGFWYPGNATYYAGEMIGSLNEHQHLEAYVGFLIRLDHALSRKRASRSDLSNALSGGMVWHRFLVAEVADETERQAIAAGVPVPPWVPAARRAFSQLGVHPHPADLQPEISEEDTEANPLESG